MRSLVPVLALLVAVPASAQEYLWTLSASTTDPYENTAAPAPGILFVELWLACSSEGMAAAELMVHSDEFLVLAFNPCCGFLNSAAPTECPLLAVGACPSGPIRAGTFLLLDVTGSGGQLCIVPCSGTGRNHTVDCEPIPALHPNATIGFSTDGTEPCRSGSCGPVPVSDRSWGRIKNGYR